MRLRLALTALGAAAAIGGSSMVIMSLAANDQPSTLDTASKPPTASYSSARQGSALSEGLGGGDSGKPIDLDNLVARAYEGCRVWARNSWPRRQMTVTHQGKEYRSRGDVWRSRPMVAYGYSVYSEDEIRNDRSLEEIEIVQQVPRDDAPMEQSRFYIRYRLRGGPLPIQRYDLNDGRCRQG